MCMCAFTCVCVCVCMCVCVALYVYGETLQDSEPAAVLQRVVYRRKLCVGGGG